MNITAEYLADQTLNILDYQPTPEEYTKLLELFQPILDENRRLCIENGWPATNAADQRGEG